MEDESVIDLQSAGNLGVNFWQNRCVSVYSGHF